MKNATLISVAYFAFVDGVLHRRQTFAANYKALSLVATPTQSQHSRLTYRLKFANRVVEIWNALPTTVVAASSSVFFARLCGLSKILSLVIYLLLTLLLLTASCIVVRRSPPTINSCSLSLPRLHSHDTTLTANVPS